MGGELSAGRLNQRVDLFRPDTATIATGTGAPLEDYVFAGTVWAEVVPSSGSESFAAQARIDQTLSRFRIRFRADVRQAWRLKWRGRSYDIVEVLPAGTQLREWLDIAAAASPAENAE